MNLLLSTYSALSGSLLIAIPGVVVLVSILGFTGASLWLWTVFVALALWGFGAPIGLWIGLGAPLLILNVPPIRQRLVSGPVMAWVKRGNFLPQISETERTVIESGSVWVEGELFSGHPNFKRINAEPYPDLTQAEQAFLDGPVEEVCRMVDDWEAYIHKDLPKAVWEYLKAHRFFGLIIPKKYGGLEFSASANSAVVQKLASRSIPLSFTVMVPNSVGPAELLVHYGTEEQKAYYLPRFARGADIPCFALTEPMAGSDAGGIRATGVVFEGEEKRLYLRLNWKKRYITLAPIATVLGLAFKLKDPDNLLGKGENPGITCALIPADTPGVEVGSRHDPLGVPFYNGPIEGNDVVVSVDSIIGGPTEAGNGWRMLMESLAAGRGISLPATATGVAKLVARVASAHAVVRRQFGLPIGRFEGIEEPLARIGGFTYLMEAARCYTCGGLDQGAKPAVVTAIAKYNFTELQRKIINDGMDILAGNAISRGPRNLLAHHYISTPILITGEGANILTRTLMIFGQGAIRCHPYLYREIRALQTEDVAAFDRAFWGHFGHVLCNLFRAALLSVSRGYFARSPIRGSAARYYQKLAWASAAFAVLADIAIATLGSNLKRREKLTGRFADIFSWMYLGIAVLRRFEAEGQRKADLPFLHWSMQYALAQIQGGFDGLLQNLNLPGLNGLFRGPALWWLRLNAIGRLPSDRLGGQIARAIQTPGRQRDSLTTGIYTPSDPNEALGRLERAFVLSYQAEEVVGKLRSSLRSKVNEAEIKDAIQARKLPISELEQLVAEAQKRGIISQEEAKLMAEAETACYDAIQVDSFKMEEYAAATLGGLG